MASQKPSRTTQRSSTSNPFVRVLELQLQAAERREKWLQEQIDKLQSLLSLKQFSKTELLVRPVRREAALADDTADPMFAPDVRVYNETADGKHIADQQESARVARINATVTEEEEIEAGLDELAEEVGGIERVVAAPTVTIHPPPTRKKK